MHRQLLIRIITNRLHSKHHLGHIATLLFYFSHHFHVQIIFQQNGLIIIATLFNLLLNIGHRNIQELANMLQRLGLIVGLLLQHHCIARQIIDQLLAILIKNESPRRNNAGLAQTVAIGLLRVVLATPQLQIHHAPHQNHKQYKTEA